MEFSTFQLSGTRSSKFPFIYSFASFPCKQWVVALKSLHNLSIKTANCYKNEAQIKTFRAHLNSCES